MVCSGTVTKLDGPACNPMCPACNPMCSRLQPYVLEAATLCAHPVCKPVQALLGGLAGIPSLPPRLAEQPLFAAQACIHAYTRRLHMHMHRPNDMHMHILPIYPLYPPMTYIIYMRTCRTSRRSVSALTGAA